MQSPARNVEQLDSGKEEQEGMLRLVDTTESTTIDLCIDLIIAKVPADVGIVNAILMEARQICLSLAQEMRESLH